MVDIHKTVENIYSENQENLEIYVDKNIMNREKVFIGGGNRVSKFFLSPETLVKLTNASIEDLT